jgi:3',5'-cyclic AMP phosphodiesterase CpdA
MLYTRRRFLGHLLGALAATELNNFAAGFEPPQSFRFAFLTDIHFMIEPIYRSGQGIAQCLAAVETLRPRPEFILVGGDIVNVARDLTVTEAQRRLDLFQKIWNDHTALPCHWVFGNHDLVATNNPEVPTTTPGYGKALFQSHFHLGKLYYSFNHRGWRFIILDDVQLVPDNGYIGAFFPEEINFCRAGLNTAAPTIVCTHIPIVSPMAMQIHLARMMGLQINAPANLVCTNGSTLISALPGHNVKAVLCGHLHRYERSEQNGIPFINSGAVCGNYWKGPVMDCPEGFGVVDVGADGSFKFDYRPYGWKARV